MTEQPAQGGTPAAPASGGSGVNWRALAPFAGLALAGVLLTAGVVTSLRSAPEPDPDAPLADATALLEKGKYDEALSVLNDQLLPMVNAQAAGKEQRRELHRLTARALYGAQEARGQDVEENNRTIVQNYLRAEELGAELSPGEIYQLARSQLSLGLVSAAAQRVKELPAKETDLRRRLIRLVVERDLAQNEHRGGGRGLDLLTEMLAEPGLSETDRAWAVARQAELQIATGHPAEAIATLLRELQKVRGAGAPQRAELRTLLGRAYLAIDDDRQAEEQFEQAERLVEPTHPLRAQTGVLLGRIHEKRNKPEEARARYEAVAAVFTDSRSITPALFGLARVESVSRGEEGSEGSDDRAVEYFARVIDEVRHGSAGAEVTADLVREALMAGHLSRVERGRTGDALRYAALAESLYPEGQAPAEVLIAMGRAHRRLAEETLEGARNGRQDLHWMDDVSPVTREVVKRHYMDAGRYFLSHARTMRMAEAAAYSASVWDAADSFDLAGDAQAAQRAFTEYIDGATDNDPRRPEARYRLAQVLQSSREYPSAAALYRSLTGGRTRGEHAGPWGDRSIVPLAQCLLRDTDPANDAEAEDLLRSAIDGRTLTPEAVEYRNGLVELGRLLYETRRYAEAIERLDEAARRYPGDREIDTILFRLADSYRLSAAAIASDLESGMALPPSEREAQREERRRRLVLAMEFYSRAKRAIEARDASRLSDLQRIQLRNAYFYLGDVAFDLGEYAPEEYQRAIEHYDTARQKYPAEPSALVAMVQIVSAHMARGEWAKAMTANELAKRHLESMPAEVWSRPDLPMERKHWERWLEKSTLLEQRAQGRVE